jgi:hypothetical protein
MKNPFKILPTFPLGILWQLELLRQTNELTKQRERASELKEVLNTHLDKLQEITENKSDSEHDSNSEALVNMIYRLFKDSEISKGIMVDYKSSDPNTIERARFIDKESRVHLHLIEPFHMARSTVVLYDRSVVVHLTPPTQNNIKLMLKQLLRDKLESNKLDLTVRLNTYLEQNKK